MRVPLSWLKDFAPFPDDPDLIRNTLDDLGLVVEEIEIVGEGLSDVIVVQVVEISAIQGADRIRRVLVDTGAERVEVVCGAYNFVVGDLVPLAPVGAVLPGGFEISRRKMKGVVSNGMLCSGKELGLSDDQEGLLVLNDVDRARAGLSINEALGIHDDVVFDIAVEGNRPDAWCISGVARDLAARMGLEFSFGDVIVPEVFGEYGEFAEPGGSEALSEISDTNLHAQVEKVSITVEAPDLCPRFVARVFTGVKVAKSTPLIARRLTLAGMRPINNVVDISNYVMLELGQPTHPYDLDRLGGRGLSVRKARSGETLETLDGEVRTLGLPGRALCDEGIDCLICDAEGTPVGVGGVMGGLTSQIDDKTHTVLLEAAYFDPTTIARTAKRLGLRTEASLRFERGCDPFGIERAVDRFSLLLAESMQDERVRNSNEIHERGGAAKGALSWSRLIDVSSMERTLFEIKVPLSRVNSVLGVSIGATEVRRLLEPIGFQCESSDDATISVRVPSNRLDIRSNSFGVADVIEEIARTMGYGQIPRRYPAWPTPGGMNAYQRERRRVKEIICGVGASEAWTKTFLDDLDHSRIGLGGQAVKLSDPLVHSESVLRRSLMPGLLRALAYNVDRRQNYLRIFEVGTVFGYPSASLESERVGRVERSGPGGKSATHLPDEREFLCVMLAGGKDDARSGVGVWKVLAEGLGIEGVALIAPERAPVPGSGSDAGLEHEVGTEYEAVLDNELLAGIHPTRSALLVVRDSGLAFGALGEVDPAVAVEFGLNGRRIGWMSIDLGLLLDPTVVPRRQAHARSISRFPSSDVDLAFLVDNKISAEDVAIALSSAAGVLLESVELFDVFRDEAISCTKRSLAYHLRFCADDRTLTDHEVGELRKRCIEAVESKCAATLR